MACAWKCLHCKEVVGFKHTHLLPANSCHCGRLQLLDSASTDTYQLYIRPGTQYVPTPEA